MKFSIASVLFLLQAFEAFQAQASTIDFIPPLTSVDAVLPGSETEGTIQNVEEHKAVNLTAALLNGAAGQDPLITPFHQKRFSFSSISDHVLLNIQDFLSGLGLRLHIRTAQMKSKFHTNTYISDAVLRIGKDVLQVTAKNYYINGEEGAEIPARLDGNVVVTRNLEDGGRGVVTKVDLGSEGVIQFTTIKNFVMVDILNANEGEFANSEGLLGSFSEAKLLARDGTEMQDLEKFAQEWKVLTTEPKLFKSPRKPEVVKENACLGSYGECIQH